MTTTAQRPIPHPANTWHTAKPINRPRNVSGWRDSEFVAAGSKTMLLPHAPPPKQRMLIPLEVYVDFVCPWCYTQTRSLQDAMDRFVATHPEVEFEVTWKPFYIAPLVKHSWKLVDYYRGSTPDEDKRRGVFERMAAAGGRYGLRFDYSGLTGPTRSAHKLSALALRRGGRKAQAQMVELLMRAQLVDGRNIADEQELMQIAVDGLGLEREDVRMELADEDATKRIDHEVEEAREIRGIEAVPCVTVLGRFKVGGFQDSQVFTDLFTKIYDEKIA